MKSHGVQQGQVQDPAPSRANIQYYYRLENEWIGSKPAEKNVEVMIDEPKMLVLAAQEDNR